MAKLEPKDGNIEKYEADIRRNTLSFQAYLKEHAHGSSYGLIEYLAESMAYQYSVNRFNEELHLEHAKELRQINKEDTKLLKQLDIFEQALNSGDPQQIADTWIHHVKPLIAKLKTP